MKRPLIFTLPRHLALCCNASALALLTACAGPGQPASTATGEPVNLAAQTPERINAAPADYRGNNCDMLARFLPLMQHARRITGGFQQTVYGWHVVSIEQVQREKGCRDAEAAAVAARSAVGGRLGIELDKVTPLLARTLGLDAVRGALVVSAGAGSAAAQAGLRAHDVIVEIAGQRVQSPAELASIVSLMAPGTEAQLGVWREGAMVVLTIGVQAAPRPGVQAAALTAKP